jgi:hypothetical protein
MVAMPSRIRSPQCHRSSRAASPPCLPLFSRRCRLVRCEALGRHVADSRPHVSTTWNAGRADRPQGRRVFSAVPFVFAADRMTIPIDRRRAESSIGGEEWPRADSAPGGSCEPPVRGPRVERGPRGREDSHVGIDGMPVWDLCTDDPYPRRAGGFYRCRLMADSDQEPPLSRQGSRLAILVHQGSDPTQPYPTLVIRDRAPRFSTASRLGVRSDVVWPTGRDGHSVGSAPPDSVDLTRSTSSLAKTAGRIVPSGCGPAPRRFWTRASSSVSGTASS